MRDSIELILLIVITWVSWFLLCILANEFGRLSGTFGVLFGAVSCHLFKSAFIKLGEIHARRAMK